MTPELEPKFEAQPTEAGGLRGKIVLDLNTSGIRLFSRVIDTSGLKRLTLDLQLFTGTWGTAVVTLKRGVGGGNWVVLAPTVVVSGAGSLYDIDVEHMQSLALDVTTPEGAAGVAHVFVYGFVDPVASGSLALDAAATTNGRLIQVTGTATGSSVTLHTATASSDRNEWDEITLYATNIDTKNILTTIEWGGTGTADQIIVLLPPNPGLIPVVARRRLRGGLVVKAFAATASKINFHVQVERVREGA